MNVGLELITSRAQKTDVAQLNLTAGKKAMASVSFSSNFDVSYSISVRSMKQHSLTILFGMFYFSSRHLTLQHSISWLA